MTCAKHAMSSVLYIHTDMSGHIVRHGEPADDYSNNNILDIY